jgi:hypothetical protein
MLLISCLSDRAHGSGLVSCYIRQASCVSNADWKRVSLDAPFVLRQVNILQCQCIRGLGVKG